MATNMDEEVNCVNLCRTMRFGDPNEQIDPLPLGAVLCLASKIVILLETKSFLGLKFANAFSGKDCVRYLKQNNLAKDEKQAVRLGNKLLNQKMISHCSSDKLPFTTSCFYTFTTPKQTDLPAAVTATPEHSSPKTTPEIQPPPLGNSRSELKPTRSTSIGKMFRSKTVAQIPPPEEKKKLLILGGPIASEYQADPI